jgi:hypothetical protein
MSQATAEGARMCQGTFSVLLPSLWVPSIRKKLLVAGFVGEKQILKHILLDKSYI